MSSPNGDGGSLQNDQEQLRRILSRDEYTVYQSKADGSGGFSLSDWIVKMLKKLFPSFDVPAGTGKAVEYGLLAVLLAVLVLAIVWFARQLVRQGRLRSWTELQAEAAGRSPDIILQQAQQLAADGRLREAVRSGFLALLCGFEQQGRIRVEGWKTNWDYAEELRRTASEAEIEEPFRDSSSQFERIWYGQEHVTAEQFERYYAQVAGLIRNGEAIRHAQVE